MLAECAPLVDHGTRLTIQPVENDFIMAFLYPLQGGLSAECDLNIEQLLLLLCSEFLIGLLSTFVVLKNVNLRCDKVLSEPFDQPLLIDLWRTPFRVEFS